ncbi:hypothetical protein ACPWR0_14165 [Pandoraea pneumonica]
MKVADDVPAMIRDQLGAWREAFIGNETSVMAFEGKRFATLIDARAGSPPSACHAREFPVKALITQLSAIRALSGSVGAVGELESDEQGGVDASYFAQMRDHLTDVRDEALHLTEIAARSRLALLNRELSEVRLLNELAAEAQPERLSCGAQVPLRLARRGDRYLLKPAETHSLFADKKKRARVETASLALLLGLPASTSVTLDVLRDRGFCGGDGNGPQWVQAREGALVGWRDEIYQILEVIEDMHKGKTVPCGPNLIPDDALMEDDEIEVPSSSRGDCESYGHGLTVRDVDENDLDRPDDSVESAPAVRREARRQTIAFGLPRMGAPDVESAPRRPEVSKAVTRPKSPPPPPPAMSLSRLPTDDAPPLPTSPVPTDDAPPLPTSPVPTEDDVAPPVVPDVSHRLALDTSSINWLCERLSASWKTKGVRDKATETARRYCPPGGDVARDTKTRLRDVAHTAVECNAMATDKAPCGAFATAIQTHYQPSDAVVYALLSRLTALDLWTNEHFAKCDASDRIFQCGQDMMWLDMQFDAERALERDVSMVELDQIMLRAAEKIDPARMLWSAFDECKAKLSHEEFAKLWPSARL